ncbi:MAG: tetratricopeptide repeat protein [Thermoguttaceae bacterium]|jgi:Flp pilus assembly protein TadD
MAFTDARHSNTKRSTARAIQRVTLALALGSSVLWTSGCASSSSSASMRNAAGVESFSAGHYDDAIVFFQDSLNDDPTNAETYYNLASAYQRKAAETGDMVLLGQAEDAYWTALEHNPNSETIVCCYRGLATSAMARGDAIGALHTLESWRDRNPDSIEPRLEIAYLLEAQQKDSEAYDVLKEVAEEAPDDYRAYYKMGVLAERAGDLEDAMENAVTAYRLNPSDASVAQRTRNLEALYAARQREEESEQEVAAEFADPAANILIPDDTTPVRTTPVQTTSAQAQEMEASPQIETSHPEGQSAGAPDASFLPPRSNDVQSAQNDDSLGFGSATSSVQIAADRNDIRDNDDSDVKWITSPKAERTRQQIAQTSATTAADSNVTGFINVNTDGTGATSQKIPNRTITTAQFESPAFAADAPAKDVKVERQIASTSDDVPKTTDVAKTADADKPRAALHSGPPRLSAGAFF